MHGLSPDFEAWVAQARDTDMIAAAESCGAQLKRQSHEYIGPCPACGGTDRFSINPGKRVFNCRGAVGGDVIEMAMHCLGIEFVPACEHLNGEPPPGREAAPLDPEVQRLVAEERRARDAHRAEQEREERDRKSSAAERLWDAGFPILGSHADRYLRARGIVLSPDQAFDLRFCPSLAYEGYPDEPGDKATTLGHFPAMLAAIRDVSGALIGVHRTYLDSTEPKKLVCPGDQTRNKAKKVLGNAKGGAIWLGPRTGTAAIAEGIETALSWFALAVGPEDVTPVAAVSLGNLAGGCTGSSPHPTKRRDGKPVAIANGEPDLDRPGVLLPDDMREVIILGDGDPDQASIRARLIAAGRRFIAEGRTVSVHMAPVGCDWNDVIRAEAA